MICNGKGSRPQKIFEVPLCFLHTLSDRGRVEIHGLSSMNPWLTYPRGHYGPKGPCSQLRSAKDCWIGEEKGVQPCG